MLTAFRRDGRKERICADPHLEVWVIREHRNAPNFSGDWFDSTVRVSTVREIYLRRERVVSPWGIYGPLEDLGFERVFGNRYDQRVDDYWSAMETAWLLDPSQLHARLEISPVLTALTLLPIVRVKHYRMEALVQFIVLVCLVMRASVDEFAFGPLCWFEAVVFVEDGSGFYERFR